MKRTSDLEENSGILGFCYGYRDFEYLSYQTALEEIRRKEMWFVFKGVDNKTDKGILSS